MNKHLNRIRQAKTDLDCIELSRSWKQDLNTLIDEAVSACHDLEPEEARHVLFAMVKGYYAISDSLKEV